MMWQKKIQNHIFSVQVIIAVNLLIIAFMLYSITDTVYKDYKNERHLLQLKKENEIIKMENKKKELDVYYFASENYRDKFAKEHEGKINPGEKVIAFSLTEENVFTENNDNSVLNKDNIYLLSPYEQWYEYFFGNIFNTF